ncbi:hypothetical protein HIM_03285 [Hirsutella minnesotensis 3608]|nr:hypothetical protein HIM_03285 [Hirsutella minnesotensis 3608]
MKNNCIFSLFFTLCSVLLILALFNQLGSDVVDLLQSKLNTSLRGSFNGQSFQQVALKYGTDKVTTHSYHHLYEKYMSSLRSRPVKMLEIGLGCNMDYGPGASYYTWLEYLPLVDLYFIESDAPCVRKHKDQTPNAHVFVGDQADVGFLDHFAANTTSHGLFDMVIDDGGHTMEQQMISLNHLWRIIKPGGLYIIEDLQTSYWSNYGGDPSRKDPAKHTTMKYLYEILDDLMVQDTSKAISQDLFSMDCMAEICALHKKGGEV